MRPSLVAFLALVSATVAHPASNLSIPASLLTARASGYIGVSGTHFTLNGSPFYFGGTNAYWLAGLSNADIDKSFKDMAALGLKVVRTFAFGGVTSPQNYGAYYTLWNGRTQTFNTGAHGFPQLDYVLSAADRVGMKVIMVIADNWGDFDLYVKQIAPGSGHDAFYTNGAIVSAYQKWVAFIVNRYKSSPTVMAWELANEPRSSSSTSVITNWIRTQAAYIKSIDSNHLVALGDEGFFATQSSGSNYEYNGKSGVDFDANLRLPHIDFGTFHLYPETWGVTPTQAWGNTWIQQHAASGRAAGKPVILEEFGVSDSAATKATVYSSWYATAQSEGLAGVAYWQYGDYLSGGNSANDGFTVYPWDTSVISVIKSNAAYMNGRH